MFRKAKAAEGAQILPWHQTFAVGIIMSMLAGYLEAYTYTLRGNVFCNGQTSNIALMMINFFRGNTAKALYYPDPHPRLLLRHGLCRAFAQPPLQAALGARGDADLRP